MNMPVRRSRASVPRVMRALALAVLLPACASGYYSGPLSMQRAEKGEIWVDTIELENKTAMLRVVAAIDVPAWRLFNMMTDFESFPLWDSTLARATLLKSDGDVHELELAFRPGTIEMPPMIERISVDPARNEASIVGFENEKVKSMQMTVKIEPLGTGERSLVNLYMHGEFKVSFPIPDSMRKKLAVDTIKNLREVVMLPRFAEKKTKTSTQKRLKLAMPPFKAGERDTEIARALSRVVAEKLMREGAWNVVTQDEVVALLNYAGAQQLVGCGAGQSCNADVGRLLAAEYILNGEVSRAGGTLVMSATLVRIKDGTVIARTSADAKDESALFERTKTAAAELAATKVQ